MASSMVPLGGIAWSFDYAVAGKWLLHGLGVKQLSHRQENCHAAPTQANSRLDSENKSTTMPIARLLGRKCGLAKEKTQRSCRSLFLPCGHTISYCLQLPSFRIAPR